jgi:hypothetical protein
MPIRVERGGGGVTDYNALSNKPDLTILVPYTGASTDVDLGVNEIKTNNLQLNTSPTVGGFSEGKIYYDVTNKTVSAMIDADITMQIGQEELVLCYNNTGVDIMNGKMVYPTGALGDMPTIALAKADSVSTYLDIGMTTQIIPNGESGFVTNRGIVHDVDTSTFTAGHTLYLSPFIAGEITSVEPTDNAHFVVKIGVALLIDPLVGSVYIRQVLNNRLTDLSDVAIEIPVVDQILTYNGTQWINGNQRAISAGAGVAFYLDSTTVIPSGVQSIGLESLNKSPSIGVEEIHSANANSSTVPLARFIYNTPLGRTKIDAGAWVFNTFCYVSSQNGISSVPVTVRKVLSSVGTITTTGTGTTRIATVTGGTPFLLSDANTDITLCGSIQTSAAILRITGFTSSSVVTVEVLTGYVNQTSVPYSTHRFLFTDANTEVNNEVIGLVTSKSIQPEFPLDLTDKLSISYYARSTLNRILYLYHSGLSNYTYFETPLAVLHNELAGLQGGLSDERYHLSLDKYTVVGNTTGTNSGDQNLSGYVTVNGQYGSISTKTTDYTMLLTDYTIIGNSTSTINIFLPLASTAYNVTLGAGIVYNIKNINLGNVIVEAFGSELIDGQLTKIISGRYNSMSITTDGVSWYII